MKLELFIVLIVSIFTANIYYDGKILSMIKSYSKYYKMGVIAFVGLCVYIYIKRSPQNRRQFFENANGYIKYLPIDRETTSVLAPIIDFTGKALSDSVNSNYVPRNQNQNQNQFSNLTGQQKKILNNSRTTKRSVSETKKKYVASSQDWKCKHCNIKLPAWFEVDHVKKLEYGGSNDIDNLEALCRDCHGKKTALENL
tara:strand:+ start:3508 stop:4101 length:594 start_codon:yes stop_codon:yes gene_type:complete